MQVQPATKEDRFALAVKHNQTGKNTLSRFFVALLVSLFMFFFLWVGISGVGCGVPCTADSSCDGGVCHRGYCVVECDYGNPLACPEGLVCVNQRCRPFIPEPLPETELESSPDVEQMEPLSEAGTDP